MKASSSYTTLCPLPGRVHSERRVHSLCESRCGQPPNTPQCGVVPHRWGYRGVPRLRRGVPQHPVPPRGGLRARWRGGRGDLHVTLKWTHIYIHPPSIPLIASLTKKTRKAKLGTFFLLWSHIYNFEMVLFPFLYILLGKASCRDTFVRTHTYALISPDSHISSFTQHLFI